MASLNTAVLDVDSEPTVDNEFLSESMESIAQEVSDAPEEIVGEGQVELNPPESQTNTEAVVADGPLNDSVEVSQTSPSEPVAEQVQEPTIATDGTGLQSIETDYSYSYVWDEEHEKRIDEHKFIVELRRATKEVEEKEALVEVRKRELETAQSEVKLAEARHKKLSITGPVYRTRPEPRKPVVAAEKQPDATKQSEAKKPTEPNEDTSWRSIKTETILDGIERFGKTKREKLLEHFPTFGELMDARTEASKEHVSFASKLPSGIGENIASELINRMDAKIVPGMPCS